MSVAAVPVPLYQIGQTVYVIAENTKQDRWPCPDCADSGKWTATSPAGETFAMECVRCKGGARFDGIEIPRLTRTVATADVVEKVLTGVEIDIMERDGGDGSRRGPVKYKAGNYSYTERHVYATREEAEAVAQTKRDAAQAKLDAAPRALASADFAQRSIKASLPHGWRADLYDAWRRARDLDEAIEAVCGEGEGAPATLAEARDHLREVATVQPWQTWKRPHPLDVLLRAAHEMLATADPDALRCQPVVAALAEALKAFDYKPSPEWAAPDVTP